MLADPAAIQQNTCVSHDPSRPTLDAGEFNGVEGERMASDPNSSFMQSATEGKSVQSRASTHGPGRQEHRVCLMYAMTGADWKL